MLIFRLAAWVVAVGSALVDVASIVKYQSLDVTASVSTGNRPVVQRLKNVGDVLYTLQVQVGGQNVSVIPDSGSFDLLVFSKQCSICGAGTEYDDSRSGSFCASNFTANQRFGSGSTKSVEAYDDVIVGPMRSKRQVFWEVVDADKGFSAISFSGILGVGPPHSAIIMAEEDASEVHLEVMTTKAENANHFDDILAHYDDVVEHTKKQHLLLTRTGMRTYSVCLGADHGSDGTWIWNDNAMEASPELFRKVPVVGGTYWSSTLTDVVLVGTDGRSTQVGCAGRRTCSALVDTGTSLLLMPSGAYSTFASILDHLISERGGCSDLTSLPSLAFKFGDQEMVLPPEAFVGQVSGELGGELRRAMPHAWKAQNNAKGCGLLAMTLDEDSDEGPVWILGLPFFRQYYTTFELNGNSTNASAMYFAKADAECNPTGPEESLTRQAAPGMRHGMRVEAKKLKLPSRFGGKKKHTN